MSIRRRQRLAPVIQAVLDAEEAADTRPFADPLTVTVPFPPSVNNAYATIVTKKGTMRRVKTERVADFAKTVRTHVACELMTRQVRPPQPPYRLTLHLYPPLDGQKHDASNAVKVPEDALMAAIAGDDNDVLEVHVFKHPKDRQPRMVMTLETLAPASRGDGG
jgi:Holliday junction resolvase RusA-like endonuclease